MAPLSVVIFFTFNTEIDTMYDAAIGLFGAGVSVIVIGAFALILLGISEWTDRP